MNHVLQCPCEQTAQPGSWTHDAVPQGSQIHFMTSKSLRLLPCQDSEQMAAGEKKELDIPRVLAAELGRSAVAASDCEYYTTRDGRQVAWGDLVWAACAAKRSIPPEAPLAERPQPSFSETRVLVTNCTTLGAAWEMTQRGLRPLALNFANGIEPGGGFLTGSKAQEEVLCRSSALYKTLVGDPMYEATRSARSRIQPTGPFILRMSLFLEKTTAQSLIVPGS